MAAFGSCEASTAHEREEVRVNTGIQPIGHRVLHFSAQDLNAVSQQLVLLAQPEAVPGTFVNFYLLIKIYKKKKIEFERVYCARAFASAARAC